MAHASGNPDLELTITQTLKFYKNFFFPDLQKHISQRQQLEGQLTENTMVKEVLSSSFSGF